MTTHPEDSKGERPCPRPEKPPDRAGYGAIFILGADPHFARNQANLDRKPKAGKTGGHR